MVQQLGTQWARWIWRTCGCRARRCNGHGSSKKPRDMSKVKCRACGGRGHYGRDCGSQRAPVGTTVGTAVGTTMGAAAGAAVGTAAGNSTSQADLADVWMSGEEVQWSRELFIALGMSETVCAQLEAAGHIRESAGAAGESVRAGDAQRMIPQNFRSNSASGVGGRGGGRGFSSGASPDDAQFLNALTMDSDAENGGITPVVADPVRGADEDARAGAGREGGAAWRSGNGRGRRQR